jgi:phospholipid transport system transporter-binding protein
MEDAQTVLAQGLSAIAEGETSIDLSGLQQFDSLAVAALLVWQRAAAKAGTALRVVHPPAGIASLAKLYGVDHLLPR